MTNITLFSQIISKLDRLKFSKLVKEKQTDKHEKGFNSWTGILPPERSNTASASILILS
jgi:hypothetical protein